jgi:hypothetical protein
MRPNLREILPAFVLVLAVACGGSKKGDTEKPGAGGGDPVAEGGAGEEQRLPEIPSSPAPLPNTVMATLSVGEPQAQLASLAAYADAVQPGFGAMLAPAQLIQGVAAVVGAPGLDGVDLTKPLHLLLLDPQKGGGQALLVVAIADKQKMAGSVGGGAVMQEHGGYAAIGAGAALLAASPYALSNLAKTRPPKHPHGVIYMNRIMESYGPQLDAQLRASMGSSPAAAEKLAAEGMIKMLSSIERIEGDLEASAQVATASFALVPQKGSILAEWGTMQKPSDYSVASRLPAGTWLMVAAGSVDWTPVKAFFTELANAQSRPELAEWISVLGTDVALALLAKEDKTLRMVGMAAVTDGAKLGQLVKDYVTKMAAAPKQMDSMQVTAKANAFRTGGATLHGITIQPGAQASAEEKKEFQKIFGKGGLKSYFGVSGNWLVFSLDKDKPSRSAAAKLVQNAKAKQPKSGLSEAFEKALAESKSRNESGVMVFDLSAIADDPAKAKGAEVTFGFGFDGPVMRSRVTVPPDTIRFFMEQRGGGAAPPPPPPQP